MGFLSAIPSAVKIAFYVCVAIGIGVLVWMLHSKNGTINDLQTSVASYAASLGTAKNDNTANTEALKQIAILSDKVDQTLGALSAISLQLNTAKDTALNGVDNAKPDDVKCPLPDAILAANAGMHSLTASAGGSYKSASSANKNTGASNAARPIATVATP